MEIISTLKNYFVYILFCLIKHKISSNHLQREMQKNFLILLSYCLIILENEQPYMCPCCYVLYEKGRKEKKEEKEEKERKSWRAWWHHRIKLYKMFLDYCMDMKFYTQDDPRAYSSLLPESHKTHIMLIFATEDSIRLLEMPINLSSYQFQTFVKVKLFLPVTILHPGAIFVWFLYLVCFCLGALMVSGGVSGANLSLGVRSG